MLPASFIRGELFCAMKNANDHDQAG